MHHWQYLIMGAYLFTTYRARLTMLPSLPLLLPHPRLLSQFCCCSFTPHLPRFLPPFAHHSAFSSRLAFFLLWMACRGLWHTLHFCPHPSYLSLSITTSLFQSAHVDPFCINPDSWFMLLLFLELTFSFFVLLSVLVTLYMLEIGMWVHSV